MKSFMLTALSTMLIGLPGWLSGQEIEVKETRATPAVIAQNPFDSTSSGARIFSSGSNFSARWNHSTDEDLNEAIARLKNAKDEDARDEAKDEIRQLLDKQYDKGLERYEEYLEELSEKIKELKSQIERRRDAKDELIDLRLQMLVHEADGLGWPDQRPRWFFPPSGFSGGGGMGSAFTMPAPLVPDVPAMPNVEIRVPGATESSADDQ